MKKVILSMALLGGVIFSSQAQTEKGKFITGGSVLYSTEKSAVDDANSSYEFSIIPNVGYFIDDNIAIGTGIGYETSKSAVSSNFGKDEAFVISPFGRYYVPMADKFHFFGQLSVPMAFGTTKATDENLEVGEKTGSSTSIGVALSPGFAYFPSSKIGIELGFNGIAYNNYSIEDADGNQIKSRSSDSFSIGANFFSPRIGVQFYF